MQFTQASRLLDPTPLPLEMGYERLENGVLHVAVRTDMHGCTGAMFDWWFGSRPGTREYRWWHPLDHVSSQWREGEAGQAVGSIHVVEERFTRMPADLLSIQFRDPTEIFDAAALSEAKAQGHVSAVLLAHGGKGHNPHRKPDGTVIGSRLIHVCRDTPWGLALRSHFFLGHDLPAVGVPLVEMARMFPDELAPSLLQHCYDEFTFLSRLLPSLFAAENTHGITPARPW